MTPVKTLKQKIQSLNNQSNYIKSVTEEIKNMVNERDLTESTFFILKQGEETLYLDNKMQWIPFEDEARIFTQTEADKMQDILEEKGITTYIYQL